MTPAERNIFRDLDFSPEEARHLEIRAELMREIDKTIRALGMTQQQAAEHLHVTQPRISDLVRGHIERFSIDTLVTMLGRLGKSVEVRV